MAAIQVDSPNHVNFFRGIVGSSSQSGLSVDGWMNLEKSFSGIGYDSLHIEVN